MTSSQTAKPAAYHLSNGMWVHPACYYERTKSADGAWRSVKIDEIADAWPPVRSRRTTLCSLCNLSDSHEPTEGDRPVRGTVRLGSILANLSVYPSDAILETGRAFYADATVPMHTVRRARSEIRYWLKNSEQSEEREDLFFRARDLLDAAYMSAQRVGPARRRAGNRVTPKR